MRHPRRHHADGPSARSPTTTRSCLGMPGMHGNYTAVTSMQRSDLLIALGSRFDDRVTGKVAGFAPEAKIIHVDIDPAELGKVRRPDVPHRRRLPPRDRGAGQGRSAACRTAAPRPPDRSAWKSTPQRLAGAVTRSPTSRPSRARRSSRSSCSSTCATPPPRTRSSCSGVGQHQMWASQYWKFHHPYTWVNSGGLGTMGFSVPAAIGAKVGRPDRMVWAVDGDGCFQMTAQELVTASAERIPIKVAILNNAYLGMVRQWQEMFYDERYSEVYLSPDLPDYVKWAEAMGCVGIAGRVARGGPAGHRQGQRDRRPPGRRRVPHRRSREGVPDGPGRQSNDDDPGRRRSRTQPSAAMSAVTSRPHPPHPVGPRREQARRAGPRRRPVRPARLQHLLARRRADRRRALQPHHDRRRRRVGAARADRQAAVQAHQRGEDHRARPADSVERELLLATVEAAPDDPRPGRRAGADLRGPDPRRRPRALTVSLEGHPTKLDDFEELLRPLSASWSCSAPAGWPCRSSSARHRAALRSRERKGARA